MEQGLATAFATIPLRASLFTQSEIPIPPKLAYACGCWHGARWPVLNLLTTDWVPGVPLTSRTRSLPAERRLRPADCGDLASDVLPLSTTFDLPPKDSSQAKHPCSPGPWHPPFILLANGFVSCDMLVPASFPSRARYRLPSLNQAFEMPIPAGPRSLPTDPLCNCRPLVVPLATANERPSGFLPFDAPFSLSENRHSYPRRADWVSNCECPLPQGFHPPVTTCRSVTAPLSTDIGHRLPEP